MKVDIKTQDLSINDSILNYLDEQLYYRLGGHFQQIRKLSVMLSHKRNAQAKPEKNCKVRISMPRFNDIVIEDSQANLYVAIYRVCELASKKLFLRMSRFEKKKRKLFVPNSKRPKLLLAS